MVSFMDTYTCVPLKNSTQQIYVCVYIYIYTYVYSEKERQRGIMRENTTGRERERDQCLHGGVVPGKVHTEPELANPANMSKHIQHGRDRNYKHHMKSIENHVKGQ